MSTWIFSWLFLFIKLLMYKVSLSISLKICSYLKIKSSAIILHWLKVWMLVVTKASCIFTRYHQPTKGILILSLLVAVISYLVLEAYKNTTLFLNVFFFLWLKEEVKKIFLHFLNNEKCCKFSHLEILIFFFSAGRDKWFAFFLYAKQCYRIF